MLPIGPMLLLRSQNMKINNPSRWHVIVHSVSPRAVRQSFEQSGFAVDPMPTDPNSWLPDPFTRFTVAHESASAMTMWLMRWSVLANCVTIRDV
jgi:hypothetical protein